MNDPIIDVLSHPLASPEWEQLPAVHHRPTCRALWTVPAPGEEDAPDERIIHARAVEFPVPARLARLGLRVGNGYHKCASGFEVDWVTSFRLLVPEGDGWRVVLEEHGLGRPDDDGRWFDLGGLETSGVLIEVRRCAVDGWWPGWNLAMTGVVLEGHVPEPSPARFAYLDVDGVDLGGLPAGVTAEERIGEVRFRSRFLEVGFRLRTAGFSYLSVDVDGQGRTERNLLQLPRSMDIVRTGVYPAGVYPVLRDRQAEYLTQGPRLATADGRRPIGLLASDVAGAVRVEGATVRYALELAGVGQRLDLRWTVEDDRLVLEAERTGSRPLRALRSSAWHVATDNRVTPTTVLGEPLHAGETGLVGAPLVWHAPRFGSLAVTAEGPATWRSDSVRPLDTNTFELKIAETPQPEGDYLLEPGTHRVRAELVVQTPALAELGPEAPPAVRRMVRRHAVTALPYRPDTATYSNNGASMHCTTTLNDLSALSVRLGPVAAGATPGDMLRRSLERWLAGAPAYGSGATSHGSHRLEDEYVMLGADTLLGLAVYLRDLADQDWLARHADAVRTEVARMRARDLDGDGLVESTLRRGVTGEHQWGSAWYDVLSFGWKDAFANAVLHAALRTLAEGFTRLGRADLADGLGPWADRVRGAYAPTFRNPVTGWFAGWRSADDVLHDYAFPAVNGAAVAYDLVDIDVGRDVLERLWAEFQRVGFRDFRLGVPLNLRRIPDDDIGGVVFGLPLGCYQQGGASHHRTRHLVDGLYRVGMDAEADELLLGLATTIADDSAFGGNGSGVDWRMWDGTPSGYEGQLAEGFGVLACAIDRYGVGRRSGTTDDRATAAPPVAIDC